MLSIIHVGVHALVNLAIFENFIKILTATLKTAEVPHYNYMHLAIFENFIK